MAKNSRDGQIRFLVENYYDMQKLRIESFNRTVAYVGSHRRLETQTRVASHKDIENHDIDASQFRIETHIEDAPVKPSVIARRIVRLKVEVPEEIADLVWYHNSLYETEKQLAKRLDVWSTPRQIRIKFLSRIQGIGPILSSGVIALVKPISRFPTISSLWAYAGLSAVHWECECDGKSKTNKKKTKHKFLVSSEALECPVRVGKNRVKCGAEVTCKFMNKPMRRRRGWLAFYNPRLKVLCWKIAASFEKQKAEKSCYRRHYVKQKKYYLKRQDLAEAIEKKVPGAKLHVRLLAMRHTSKRFLADLWIFWRTLEGLPVTKPYSNDILRHSYEPWEPDKPEK